MEYFFFRIKIWKEKSIFTFIYLMCPYFADHTSWSTLFVAYICKRILKIGYLFTIFQVQCMHYLSGFFFLLSVVHSLRLVAYFWRSSMEFPIWFRDIFTHLFVHSYFKLFFLHSSLFLLWLHFDESHGRIDGWLTEIHMDKIWVFIGFSIGSFQSIFTSKHCILPN